jgi:hypothetical protein
MDENMNMPLEEFCPEINSFDEDVPSAKAASPTTGSASKSDMPDSTTQLDSNLSAAASSLLAPVCTVDDNTINLPSDYSASEIVSETICDSKLSQNHSEASVATADIVCEAEITPSNLEASGVADDKFIKPEPGEADQPAIAVPAQRSLSSFVIDLTEEYEEQSILDRLELPEADGCTVAIPAQRSLGSLFIDLTEESKKQSGPLQETQQVESRNSSSKFRNQLS